jgi:hypothetical protein
MCSRPVALPPFFPRPSQMPFQTGKKRGVSGHPPFLSSLENRPLEQSETKKYHVEAHGCTRNRLLFLVMHVEGLVTLCRPEFS